MNTRRPNGIMPNVYMQEISQVIRASKNWNEEYKLIQDFDERSRHDTNMNEKVTQILQATISRMNHNAEFELSLDVDTRPYHCS